MFINRNMPFLRLVVEGEQGGGSAPVDPPAAPESAPADPSAPEAPPAAAPDDAEVAKWKALARKHETAAKANADAAKKLKAIEDQSKSEADKAAERATAAEARIAALSVRAVRAEIKALAAKSFADPEDAAAFLDAASYVAEDGEVDAAAITKDLADLLKRKPHLGGGGAGPVDLGQGSRGAGPSIDQQIAAAQKRGDWAGALALKAAAIKSPA